MPALADRDRYEASIVAGLAPIFQEQYERSLNARRLSDIGYGQFESDMRRLLSAEVFKAFTSASAALIIGQSLVFTSGAFEEAAQRWADNFAHETAEQVTDTSKRLTAEAWTIGQGDRRAPHQIEADFQQALQGIYSPARMNGIAVTSVTAAVSNGEHAVIFFFPENRQRRLVAVWMCGERFPFGSPAHPGCRCHLLWMSAEEWARRAA